MAKPVICGKCKEPMRKGERLKTHWRTLHPQEFYDRMIWLGQTDIKLKAAKLLAEDGMKKESAEPNYGPEYRRDRNVEAARYAKQVNEVGVQPDDEKKHPEEVEE